MRIAIRTILRSQSTRMGVLDEHPCRLIDTDFRYPSERKTHIKIAQGGKRCRGNTEVPRNITLRYGSRKYALRF